MLELLKDTKKQFTEYRIKCNHAYDSGGNKTRKFYLELAEDGETDKDTDIRKGAI